MFKDVIDRFAAKLLLVQAPPAFPIGTCASTLGAFECIFVCFSRS